MQTNSLVSYFKKTCSKFVNEFDFFSPDTHNEDGPLNLEQDAPELDVPPKVTRTSSQSTSSQPLKRKKPSK